MISYLIELCSYQSFPQSVTRMSSYNYTKFEWIYAQLIMLEFIRTTIFGSRIFQRVSSVQVDSKLKGQGERRKPFSFDSKQKQKKDALMTSMRHQYPDVIAFDQTMTVKKYSPFSRNQNQSQRIAREEGMVSDIEESDDLLRQTRIAADDNKALSVNPEKLERTKILLNNAKKMDEMAQSAMIPQNCKKILIKRENSKGRIKSIKEKCAICNKTLQTNDSLQLACTHRYHKTCANQMKWRMRYKCDACEVKHDHKKCSILLRNVSRRMINRD